MGLESCDLQMADLISEAQCFQCSLHSVLKFPLLIQPPLKAQSLEKMFVLQQLCAPLSSASGRVFFFFFSSVGV